MPTGNVSLSCTIAGVSISSTITRTGEGAVSQEVTLAAGEAGSLTTRTSDSAGTITMDAATVIETADEVDVFWASGKRYGVTVGTVSGTTVPISGGAGDNLPVQDTALTISVRTSINMDFDGDQVKQMVISSSGRASTEFLTSGSVSIKAVETPAGEFWLFADGQGETNPFASNVCDTVSAGNGSTSANVLKITAILDTVA